MNKKCIPHIIAVGAFVVFIVLGLASATSPDVKNVASIDELTSIRDKFAWLNSNAETGGNYILEVNANSTVGSMSNYAVNLSYKDKNNITITLKGVGGKRTISSYQKSGIFNIGSGVTLILDENVHLQGIANGSAIDKLVAAVRVSSGGTLIMNEGSSISGNLSYQDGGGVYVATGGTFIMNGGLISENFCFQVQDQALVMATDGKSNAFSETPRRGGGVFIDVEGTFTKTGGTITGFGDKTGNFTRTFNNLDFSQNNGHAVFAALGTPGSGIFASRITGSKRKETTAGPDVNFSINSNGSFSGDWDF